MKSVVLKGYGWLHSKLVGGLRRLPVSSRSFGPPKGLITDMREWIRKYQAANPAAECWYRKVHDAAVIQRHPPRSLDEVPPVFQEEQTVQQPEAFVASIPQARLFSHSGVIIAPDDRAFEESCCWKSFFFTRDIEFNTLRQKSKPTRLAGSYLTLISRHSASYYHWFTECLTRLAIADSLPASPILLQDDLRDWQRESLAMLGVEEDRLVQLPRGCYEVDQLYFPSFPAYATFTTDWSFSPADWPLLWLREKFCGNRSAVKDKQLYVSRQGAAHRRVINEDEVMRTLEREGFLIVDANPLSLAEKIALFRDAATIVSAHSAGLTHILFAPAGAIVVEALDPFHLMGGLYYQMAAALGQDYWYLFAENQAWKSAQPRDDFQIDPRWPFQTGANGVSRKGYDDLSIPIDVLLRTIEASEASGLRSEPPAVAGG
jgi:capsular polysaccharide biosynthesis protein